MANHWLREIRFSSATRAGISFYSKMLCWWMYHVLGYTNFSESLGGGGSYDPTDYTGVTYATGVGSINVSGTDGYFRDDTNSPFTAGDVGKWILLVDPNNGENSGWYAIDGYVDADRVSIDYRSGAAEYPVQNTGDDMSYYMMAEDNNTPNTVNDEWQLRTPHADSWEIKFIIIGNYYLRCIVALDTFAVGNKILELSSGTWRHKHFGQTNQGLVSELYYYAYGTDDGSKLCIYLNSTSSTAGVNGLTMAKMIPFETEPAHTDDELWVLGGTDQAQAWNAQGFERNIVQSKYNGFVWREADSSVNVCYALEWSYNDFGNGFTYWTSNEANARTGKNDLKPGITLVIDPFNAVDKYEIMGEYAPFEMVRRNFNNMQTIDDVGTKDKLHIYDGFVIPWPGVTPQFLPL